MSATGRNTVLQEFRFRVKLYSDWDKRLAPQTRFFAAAALINTALVDLCMHRAAALLLSRATMDFLSKTGRSLELLNVALANRVHSCEILADDLDHFMVLTEQNIVEHALQAVRATDTAAFSNVVTQLNCLLQLTEYWFRSRDGSGRYSYARAFVSVRNELRRPMDFASKEDRIRLGRRLISHLRVSVQG